ncbi:unnamed protein product [Caenorhabditis sp. 36 PRJEB53466]|nr:unnamed protein product [Caenorhabditis sp. 36 PRJEB53466]
MSSDYSLPSSNCGPTTNGLDEHKPARNGESRRITNRGQAEGVECGTVSGRAAVDFLFRVGAVRKERNDAANPSKGRRIGAGGDAEGSVEQLTLFYI